MAVDALDGGTGSAPAEVVRVDPVHDLAVLRRALPGMSGAPVRRCADDVVVGVVSGRYNSADGWLRDSVWVARTEHLESLLAGMADVEVGGRAPLGGAVDLVLTVSETEVRLHGGGVDVTAAHRGVRPGLAEAINDVRRARTRVGGLRGASTDVVASEVSLRRAGVLLAESFLPGPVSDAMADVLRWAEAEHMPVRVGVAAPGLSWLPWEALPDPVSGRPLALQIDERLGNQIGMATSWYWLGDLATERQQYTEGTVWHIRALLVWLSLQVPHVAYGAHALAAQRCLRRCGEHGC